MTKSCKNCIFYWEEGTGYSDWTWMDTLDRCALGAHPNFPRNKSDEDDAEYLFAKECKRYDYTIHSEPPCVSPDGHLQGSTERMADMLVAISK